MAAPTVPSVFTAVDKFSTPIRRMTRATTTFATKAQVQIAKVERSFRRLTSPIRKVNKLLGGFGLLLGGALLISTFTSVVSVFKDFEQANATLASVMADATSKELRFLSEEAKRLGATTARSATEVVKLQESFARLGFSAPDIARVTESVIFGSVAMNAEADEVSKLAGAMANTFDNLSRTDIPNIIDQFVRANQATALDFPKLQTALPIVGAAANAIGVPLERLLALIGKLSDAGLDASMSSTALRNIFIESRAKGTGYAEVLEKIANNQDLITASDEAFGRRAAVPGSLLAKKITETASLEIVFSDVDGAARKAAIKQLDTLNGALTILRSSYEGFILAGEDGTGTFAETLKLIVQATSQMFSLAGGTAIAVEKLTEQEKKARELGKTFLFWAKAILYTTAAMLAFKILVGLVKTVMVAYNVVIGVAAFANGTLTVGLRKNVVAFAAFKTAAFLAATATKIWTASIWLLDVALWSNPIGLVVLAILGIITATTMAIKKYDEWGASFFLVTGQGINLIQSFRRNWELVEKGFNFAGIRGGFLAIGVVIVDSILKPFEQFLELLIGLPIIGEQAARSFRVLNDFRRSLGTNEQVATVLSAQQLGPPTPAASPFADPFTGEGTEVAQEINPEETRRQSIANAIIEQRQNVAIEINDNTGNASVESDNNFIPVNLTQNLRPAF